MTLISVTLAFNVTRKNGVEFTADELAGVVEQTIARVFPKMALTKGGVLATVGPREPDVKIALQRVKAVPMAEAVLPHEQNGHAQLPPAVSPSLPSSEPRLRIVP